MLQRAIEIVSPMPATKPFKLVEAAAIGMIRIGRATVPLAKITGAITGLLKHVTQRRLIEVEAFGPPGHPAYSRARIVAAGEDLGPSRRAQRRDIKPVEVCPFSGQLVDAGRMDIVIALAAEIAPALVISEDQQHIRSVHFSLRNWSSNCARQCLVFLFFDICATRLIGDDEFCD